MKWTHKFRKIYTEYLSQRSKEIKLSFDSMLIWSRFLFASRMENRTIQGKIRTKEAEVKPCTMSRTSNLKKRCSSIQPKQKENDIKNHTWKEKPKSGLIIDFFFFFFIGLFQFTFLFRKSMSYQSLVLDLHTISYYIHNAGNSKEILRDMFQVCRDYCFIKNLKLHKK